LAASFALNTDIPADIAALGITAENVSPGRSCVVDPEGAAPVVGTMEEFE
jgi:D-arginine dehydrogenase